MRSTVGIVLAAGRSSRAGHAGTEALARVEGASALSPVEGASALSPVEGASALSPVEGASALSPVEGASALSRVPGTKALALLDGATFLERTCASLRVAGAMPIVVVVAEPHAFAIERALPPGCVAVRNASPERGMLGSLQVGLEHAMALGAGRVVVSLIDHPGVRASTVRALLEGLEDGALVCRPRYAGRRGHPYAITGAAIDRLRAAPTTARARDVLRAITPARELDVDDPAVLQDLDRLLPSSDRARPSRALVHDADRSLSR